MLLLTLPAGDADCAEGWENDCQRMASVCLLDQPVCKALKTNLGADRRGTVPELKTIGGTSLEGAFRNHIAQLCFKKGELYLRLFLIYLSHLFSICSEQYFNILMGRICLLSISP